MISILICIIAFALCLYGGRRSLVVGLTAVLGVGYAYGILRANLAQSASHFIFDAAVLGLYVAQLRKPLSPAQRLKARKLKPWVFLLIGWPLLLLLAPVQDFLVELVGLRGNIFLIPFLLLGARLTSEDLYTLATRIGWLNIVAFGFAGAEFFLGVDHFIPNREKVTTIIYLSADASSSGALRIPSVFTSSAAYAGAMVTTIPLLVGAWVQKHRRAWHGHLLLAAIIASIVGTFMAASRTQVVVLFVLLVATTVSGHLRIAPQFGWLILLLGVGWVVSSEERLQRFVSLGNTDFVAERISGSVNKRFTALAVEYPMGNGLGGGGTSIPYFLQNRIKKPVGIESEYARIMLEQGVPGLCLWVAFVFWAFLRRVNSRSSSWDLGRRLAWITCIIYFALGLLGTGLLTSIPQTCILLLLVGWINGRQLETNEKLLPVSNPLTADQRTYVLQPELSVSR